MTKLPILAERSKVVVIPHIRLHIRASVVRQHLLAIQYVMDIIGLQLVGMLETRWIVPARAGETMMIAARRVVKRERLVKLYFAKTTYLRFVILLVSMAKMVGKRVLLTK